MQKNKICKLYGYYIKSELIGFSSEINFNNKLFSYYVGFDKKLNKENSIYFSSCTDRNMFKIYKNISHKVIWQAIQYLKLANCKKFYLGVTKSIYSKSLISDKEKSIDLFKSSFGGDKDYFIIINNIESI